MGYSLFQVAIEIAKKNGDEEVPKAMPENLKNQRKLVNETMAIKEQHEYNLGATTKEILDALPSTKPPIKGVEVIPTPFWSNGEYKNWIKATPSLLPIIATPSGSTSSLLEMLSSVAPNNSSSVAVEGMDGKLDGMMVYLYLPGIVANCVFVSAPSRLA